MPRIRIVVLKDPPWRIANCLKDSLLLKSGMYAPRRAICFPWQAFVRFLTLKSQSSRNNSGFERVSIITTLLLPKSMGPCKVYHFVNLALLDAFVQLADNFHQSLKVEVQHKIGRV